MRATIDEQGRVLIPRSLRESLNLNPDAVVEVLPSEDGLTMTLLDQVGGVSSNRAVLLREGSLIVLGGTEPLTTDEVTAAIEMARDPRRSASALEDEIRS